MSLSNGALYLKNLCITNINIDMNIYITFCSLLCYPMYCMYLGLEIEITITFIHLLFLLSPTITIFLSCVNLLLVSFIVQEIMRIETILIQSKSRLVYKKECIVCYETKIRSHQLNCCKCSILCRSCFNQVNRCPICRRFILKDVI